MEIELEKLKNSLDLTYLNSKPGMPKLTEILLKSMPPLKFRMEQDSNHSAPHLHITYGKQNHAASYGINDGQRLAGNLPNKFDKDVTNWINSNRSTLLQIWDGIQSGNQQKYEISIGLL